MRAPPRKNPLDKDWLGLLRPHRRPKSKAALPLTSTWISGAVPASSASSRALSVSSLRTTSGHLSEGCPICLTNSGSLQKSSSRDVRKVSRCRVCPARDEVGTMRTVTALAPKPRLGPAPGGACSM
jgi:hypothetical protein